jgi:hypothetical protein
VSCSASRLIMRMRVLARAPGRSRRQPHRIALRIGAPETEPPGAGSPLQAKRPGLRGQRGISVQDQQATRRSRGATEQHFVCMPERRRPVCFQGPAKAPNQHPLTRGDVRESSCVTRAAVITGVLGNPARPTRLRILTRTCSWQTRRTIRDIRLRGVRDSLAFVAPGGF